MYAIKLNLSKVDKNRLFKGEKGTYGDFIAFQGKNGQWYVKHSSTKEEREAGLELPIIGDMKELGKPAQPKPETKAETPSDDLPF
jgi:hypothetical protein